jgi:serine acetyltransferase
VIAAGAVVVENVEANTVVGGVPARRLNPSSRSPATPSLPEVWERLDALERQLAERWIEGSVLDSKP